MERGSTKYPRPGAALLSLWSRGAQCSPLSSHSGWLLDQYCVWRAATGAVVRPWWSGRVGFTVKLLRGGGTGRAGGGSWVCSGWGIVLADKFVLSNDLFTRMRAMPMAMAMAMAMAIASASLMETIFFKFFFSTLPSFLGSVEFWHFGPPLAF